MSDEQPLWGSQRPDDPPEHEEADDRRPDPRLRPPDPAGTQPKHHPDELVPRTPAPLLASAASAPPRPPHDADAAAEPGEDDDLLPERRAAGPAPAAAAAAGPGRYTPRFQFLTGMLVAIAIAAVVALGAIIAGTSGDDGAEEGPAWSAWRPLPGAGEGPEQIAEHVGRQYRHSNGKQLALVTGGPMELTLGADTLPLEPVLTDERGDFERVEGSGVLYRVCGLGPQCALKGRPSQARFQLLRREALELALYSSRYLEDIDYTMVMLPPAVDGKTGKPAGTQVLLMRKGELGGALARPLDASLFHRTPNTATMPNSPDLAFVDQATLPRLFRLEGISPGNQEAKAYVVLEKPKP